MTKYYEEKALTAEQIKSKNLGATIFKAYLLSEDGFELEAVVGRYEDLTTAKNACRSYANEEIDGEACFLIKQYYRTIRDDINSKVWKLVQIHYC